VRGPTDRIALLFATSGHSGVDRVIANLLPEFGRSSYLFDLLVIGKHGPSVPLELPQNLRVLRLPVRTKKLVLPPLLTYLIRHRPRAILTANHQLNRAALIARYWLGQPPRVTIRMGMSLSALGAEMSPRRRQRLFASMQRWYPRADAVITPSEGVGQDIIRLAGVSRERLHIIRNPIVNATLLEQSRAPVEHCWFRDGEPPVILGVGSLEPRKDFATLLRAFAKLRADIDCRLVILGDGSDRNALQELARSLGIDDAFDLPGFATNPYRYMRRASVFALTSRREGAPAVIVEALACGTPVVSTDCPSGPAEILGRLDAPALAPVGDVNGIANALLAILRNPPSPDALEAVVGDHKSERSASAYLKAVLDSGDVAEA